MGRTKAKNGSSSVKTNYRDSSSGQMNRSASIINRPNKPVTLLTFSLPLPSSLLKLRNSPSPCFVFPCGRRLLS